MIVASTYPICACHVGRSMYSKHAPYMHDIISIQVFSVANSIVISNHSFVCLVHPYKAY